MAKPQAPLLSLGASGTIAKTLTFASWKGRAYVKHPVAGVDPRTAPQAQARDVFKTGDAIWVPAPELLKAPWDRFAAGQVKSGYNAWLGRFVRDNLGRTDLQNITLSPGAAGGLRTDAVVLTAGPSQITVDFTNPAPPAGWTLESAVAAAIRDGDPTTTTFLDVTAGEDDVAQAQVVLGGLTNGVLYVVGAWLRWRKPGGSAATSVAYGPSITGTATPDAPYMANPVHFDGVNDWLTRGADLTGAANNDKGIFSAWIDLTGGDTANRMIFRSEPRFVILRNGTNKIQFTGLSAASTTLLNMLSATSYTAAGGWFHILASWNLAAGDGWLYIDDADDLAGGAVLDAGDIAYSGVDAQIGVSLDPTPFFILDADVADVYMNYDTFLDLSVVANRRKFIDAGGCPVSLGPEGATPTGVKPIVFLSGATPGWHTNLGPGGGFTETGALTDGGASPCP